MENIRGLSPVNASVPCQLVWQEPELFQPELKKE